MKKSLGIILSLMLILTTAIGCSAAKTNTNAEAAGSNAGTASSLQAITVNYDEDDYYFDWKNSSYQTISLNGSSANVTGEGVKAENSTVTISQSGVYEITGNLSDGSIIVDVDKDKDEDTVFLVLNGASVESQTSAPIYVKDAKKAVILLEKDTNNSVADGNSTVVNDDGEPSAAIFSKADLTISGSGTLTVTGNSNDGITSKDDLKITEGTLTVNAKADGIVGKDILSVKDGNLTIHAGKDGMRSTNETDADKGNVVIQNGQFTVIAANDAIQAVKQVQIDDGQLNLTSGGGYPGKSINSGKEGFGGPTNQNSTTSQGTDASQSTDASQNAEDKEESQKGLKGNEGILINGGTINVSSYEDSVHSNNEIDINGGTLTVQSGDDAIHADNNLFISNGEIAIQNSYESLEAANITVSGGKITAASSDDGINVNNREGVLTISGGEIALNANGDGMDSNGGINMTGGTIYVDGPVENMNGAIDYDQSFAISGGTLMASGSSGMAQAPSDNTQPSILMCYSSTQTAGSTITLKDKDGAVVASFTPTKDYSSVAISSPKLSLDSSYTLYSNDTKIVDFTPADSLTYLNESGITSKPSGPGGGGGGMGPGGAGGMRPGGAGGMPSRESGTAPDNNSSQE